MPLNSAAIATDGGGLRIAVAADQTWGVARLNECQLPADATGVRLTVREISPGATWVLKMAGDFYRTGTVTDLQPFAEGAGTGERSVQFDADVRARLSQPVHNLQLGVVGPAGSTVVFDGLEFTH